MEPTPLQKSEYDNAQFDAEVPSNLSGVMSRWIVPEGAAEDDPVLFRVPFTQNVEIEEEGESYQSTIPLPQENIIKKSKTRFLPYLFCILGFLFFLITICMR